MTGPITRCQSCDSPDLDLIVSLGNLPPCNDLRPIGEPAREQATYPNELFRCTKCELAQLGFVAPQKQIFGADYPYRSSVTKALRDNFRDLYHHVTRLLPLAPNDLVIDIGGNDGNLLSNFTAHRTLNVTPEDMGRLGEERGIPHLQRYWGNEAADEVLAKHGKAKVVTATNVFAHVPEPHGFVESALSVLEDDGLFVTESHYLGAMVKGVQFDAIYSEHQRVYSCASLYRLLRSHGLVINDVRRIDTHGGSIRVVASRRGTWADPELLHGEQKTLHPSELSLFAFHTQQARRGMWRLLENIDALGGTVAAIGAPSRSGTLVSYIGLQHTDIAAVYETPGSYKIGRYMPGTRIPILDEARLYEEQPDFAILFSHHIADELMEKIRAKGFRGKFVTPLPSPQVVDA